MNVIGIIAEYNPFHNGHAYQIAHVRKNLHADYIVVATSGDYVQRGEPALLDKYTRARMQEHDVPPASEYQRQIVILP